MHASFSFTKTNVYEIGQFRPRGWLKLTLQPVVIPECDLKGLAMTMVR